MKLIGTPWMSQDARRGDLLFSNDADAGHSPQLALEYALLAQGLPQSSKGGGSLNLEFFGPMEVLGIVLLELCFWSLLQSQKVRKSFPQGGTERVRRSYDLLAAKIWKAEVLCDSGLDYQQAVDWCFHGNHSNTSSPQWRREMFRKVIQPLENCHRYLGGVAV